MNKRKVVGYNSNQWLEMRYVFNLWRRSTGASASSQEVICKEWMAGNLSLIVSVPQLTELPLVAILRDAGE